MNNVVKSVFALVVLCVVSAGLYAYALTHGFFEIDAATLEQKYKLPTSQFIELDGIRVHYTDEGLRDASAPPVLLLHASTFNLRMWDQLVAVLVPKYRVIRLDFPGSGLTGHDPKERYSLDLNMLVVEALMAKLEIKNFAVVGTSTGGATAFRYAAAHPEQINRLVLINTAGMPRTTATDPNRNRSTTIDQRIERYYKSEAFYRKDIARYFITNPPPPGLIEMVYDMNRREGRAHEFQIYLKNFETGDPKATLSKIVAPTYILWGMDNLAVMHLEADVIEHWLTSAPSLLKKYPKTGHYPYLEIPREVEADVTQFLSTSLDDQLRVTKRLSTQAAAAACPSISSAPC